MLNAFLLFLRWQCWLQEFTRVDYCSAFLATVFLFLDDKFVRRGRGNTALTCNGKDDAAGDGDTRLGHC